MQIQTQTDSIRETADRLVDPNTGSRPPVPVLQAIRTLAGARPAVAVMGAREVTEEGTSWKCIVLTDTHLVIVGASRADDGDWRAGSRLEEPSELLGRRWDMEQIVRVEVRSVEDRSYYDTGEWKWRVSLALILNDGSEVLVPPNGVTNSSNSECVDGFVQALID